MLRRDGRLHDFEYLEYRAILRQRAQQPENNAQKPSTALPGQTPILREYRAYSETAARLCKNKGLALSVGGSSV